MSMDISSLLGTSSSSSAYGASGSSSSSSETSETDETSLLEEILEEMEEAAEEKKAEEKIAARQEMLNADDTAIDMTKNDRLASSTLRSLFESSGE